MNYRKQFIHMFIIHLKNTYREKQAWFWGIFFPVILMVIFMLIFSNGSDREFQAEIAIVDIEPNDTSIMLLEQIKQVPVFKLKSDVPVTLEQGESWVKEKDVDAVIVLPNNLSETSIMLIVNKENEQQATTQVVSGVLDKLLQQANLAAVGATPTYELKFNSISSGNENLEYEDFLLTGMIGLAVAQGGMFGMVDMVEMRRKGLLTRLRMTPARMELFGLSDMVMRMIFGLVQLILLSLIGVFIFGASLHINFLTVLVIFLVGALTFNALGYLFSSFSKTTESYMGISNITNFLMMFLSGVFFPIETMPSWLQHVATVLPLTYFVEGLREGMVYASGMQGESLWLGIGIMVVWGAVSYIIGSLLYRRKSLAVTR